MVNRSTATAGLTSLRSRRACQLKLVPWAISRSAILACQPALTYSHASEVCCHCAMTILLDWQHCSVGFIQKKDSCVVSSSRASGYFSAGPGRRGCRLAAISTDTCLGAWATIRRASAGVSPRSTSISTWTFAIALRASVHRSSGVSFSRRAHMP
jgi:hypothetical protein